MAVYLNQLPTKEYNFVLHLDTEEHCFSRLPEEIVRIDTPRDIDRMDILPKGAAVVMERYRSVADFRDYIATFIAALVRKGVMSGNVLVVCDCWGAKDETCNPRSRSDINEHDWAPLISTHFDISIWSGQVCSLAHEMVAAFNCKV